MEEHYEVRRRFPRVPSENAVMVTKLSEDRLEGFTKTRVMGLGGCLLVSDERLGVGSLLEILISVRGRVAKSVGRVVYEIPKADKEVEVGVEFVDIDEPDREVIEGLFTPPGAGSA